jgi:hypothetical protein
MNGLIIGRTVHYVFREADERLKHSTQIRPAIVTGIIDKENGIVNLVVMLEMPNDRNAPEAATHGCICAESFVPFSSEGKKKRTWKFPPKS